MLRSVIALILFLFIQSLSAQSLHSKNKKAIESFNQAKELGAIGNLYKSEELLNSALKRDKSFDEAILLLHQLYLRRDEFDKSESVLKKYQPALEQEFINRVLSDQANYQYELGNYHGAQSLISSIQGEVYGLPKRMAAMLFNSVEFAIDQLANPISIDFEELPKPINEFEKQYFPSITLAEQLVFTVRENNGKGDENLFSSSYVNGSWSRPESISSKINSDRNEGAASISLDGSTLVFTACNVPGNIGSCDLYISYLEKDEWTSPELLGNEVNSVDWESQPSLSRDGSVLYFVSRREGGLGGADIWLSKKTTEGWSKAENLGPKVNTAFDDLTPYIYADNKTLFFSSKGRLGMGGLDLFVSDHELGDWNESRNLGYPINNAFDQVGYSISPQGWAYYSSSNESGRILLNRFRVPAEIIPDQQLAIVEAKVLDEKTREFVGASISLYGEVSFENSASIISKLSRGLFRLVSDNDSVNLKVEASGYLTRNISILELNNLPNREMLLRPLESGKPIQFGMVNFDFGSSDIKPSSHAVLNSVVTTIIDNPKLIIEIGGHTDKVGEGIDNMTLSLERAESVYRYLVEKGVAKENLVFKGYGEDHPLKGENAEIDNKQNRRIEFKVIGFLK